MGHCPLDFDPMGSPNTAMAMKAQHTSFLLDGLQEFRRTDAAMHTIKEKLGKNGVLRPALAWGCLSWQQ
jgi:hypothetical protein